MTPSWNVIEGDCRDVLAGLPAGSVHTVVTSPPYFGLRDYGTGEWEGGNDPACEHLLPATSLNVGFNERWGHGAGQRKQETMRRATYGAECGRCGARRVDRQIGLEPTPNEFVAALVDVFREVRRVLRDDGTVWLNLGSSFASGIIESDAHVLRDDLSTDDIAYVYAELARAKSAALPDVRPSPTSPERDVPGVLPEHEPEADELHPEDV